MDENKTYPHVKSTTTSTQFSYVISQSHSTEKVFEAYASVCVVNVSNSVNSMVKNPSAWILYMAVTSVIELQRY